MNPTREQIMAALWAKVSNITGIKTSSRRLLHWDDIAPADQPALFMAQGPQVATLTRGFPLKWLLHANLHLYVNSGENPNLSPAPALNTLLDAIEAALAPGAGAYQTLGGLVHDCWINGQIETLEGTLGAQEAALIPITIDTTA